MEQMQLFDTQDARSRTACFTGHRALSAAKWQELQPKLERVLLGLIEKGYDTFVAGGALGFDTLAALTVLQLRERYPHLRLELMLPCADQTARWKEADICRYEEIRKRADAVTVLTERYYNGCMQVRNRAMVEQSSVCICWLTHQGGGTAQTVAYAQGNGSAVLNLD